jgi:hypothetical protein
LRFSVQQETLAMMIIILAAAMTLAMLVATGFALRGESIGAEQRADRPRRSPVARGF